MWNLFKRCQNVLTNVKKCYAVHTKFSQSWKSYTNSTYISRIFSSFGKTFFTKLEKRWNHESFHIQCQRLKVFEKHRSIWVHRSRLCFVILLGSLPVIRNFFDLLKLLCKPLMLFSLKRAYSICFFVIKRKLKIILKTYESNY